MNVGHAKDRDGLHAHLRRRVHWKTVALRLAIGLSVLSGLIWIGSHATDEIEWMQSWVVGHGVWGHVAFVCIVILFTSLFVPGTLFAIAAGALFGLAWGTVLMSTATIATAVLNFFTARSFLGRRIQSALLQHPKWSAVQRAADREGLRLQLLLRLSPLNPVAVSYALGASGARWTTFMIGTLGLIPGLLVEVYFGYLASHVSKVAGDASEHTPLRTIATVIGFAVSIVLMVFIARMAAHAIAETDDHPASEGATTG